MTRNEVTTAYYKSISHRASIVNKYIDHGLLTNRIIADNVDFLNNIVNFLVYDSGLYTDSILQNELKMDLQAMSRPVVAQWYKELSNQVYGLRGR